MEIHYMTVLRDCFLQWPQNTLLVQLQPCHLQIPQTWSQLSQPWLQNSFWTNHKFRSWHHPSSGTPWSNMMISSCFVNQWKVGSPFRIFQQRHQRIPLQNPTPLDWSMCSIFWATLATGSLTNGSQLAQLTRLRRRKRKLQPSWTTCHWWWTMQFCNTAESTNWKMFPSDLESYQMNLLTISELLLINAISQQKTKRNEMSSTDL